MSEHRYLTSITLCVLCLLCAPARGQELVTCLPDEAPGIGIADIEYFFGNPLDIAIPIIGAVHFDVTIFISRDGTALALGAASRGRGRFRAGPVRLVAQSQGTSAECADVDGDGTAGFTLFEIVFRHVVSGERFIALVEPANGVDIHRKRRYRANVLLEGPDGFETWLRGVIRLR